MRYRWPRGIFWLGVWLLAIVEKFWGVCCCGCGERQRLPVPPGWRYVTSYDGRARWHCVSCLREQRDPWGPEW